jgi:endonuclease/exonuclease/phosphatase (EEP) superfamily protein YafD
VTLLRLLAAALAAGLSLAAAGLAIAGLGGWRSAWLDVINCFAPMILAMALTGAALALWSIGPGAGRSTVLAFALIGAGYGLALTAPEVWMRWPAAAPAPGETFRVLTANVWHDNPSPDHAIADILKRDPDAVLMQEADGTLAASLPALKSRYPYASHCPGSGVIIFVKAPITGQGCKSGVRTSGGLNLVWVHTRTAGGAPLTLATTHFAWPFPPPLQAIQRRALAEAVKALPQEALILAGDFNTTPWSFAMRRQDGGLSPLRRLTRARFSWPARIDRLSLPWSVPVLPIDHVYAGSDWALARVERVCITGSDHFAIEVSLRRSAS